MKTDGAIFLLVGLIFFILVFIAGCTINENPEDASGNSGLDEASVAESEPDCVRGEENCQYPGKCFLYEDADSNGVCDRSE